MRHVLAVAAGVFVWVALAANPASATPLPSLTVNGETFTITACAAAECANLIMVQDGTNTGVIIEDKNNAPMLSLTTTVAGNRPGGVLADLTLTLTISGTQVISDITGSIQGNATSPSDLNFMTLGESGTAGGNGLIQQTATVGSPLDVTVPTTPVGYTSVDMTKDIHIGGAIPVIGTMNVTSVKQGVVFKKIPEPASLMIAMVGLMTIGCAVTWRRSRA